MQAVFDVYFEHKLAEELKQHYASKPRPKSSLSPAKNRSKSPAAKNMNKDLDDDAYSMSGGGSNKKEDPKKDQKAKTLSDKKAPKRPQSAAGSRTMDAKAKK